MTPITLSWTVNDVMRCYPISILLFNNLGVDTSRGATATLETAATNAGMMPEELLARLVPCTDDDDIMPLARTLQDKGVDHSRAR